MRMPRFLFPATLLLLALLPAAHATEFRDYYEPEDIAAYNAALKRKDFRAQIHWKPLIVAAADNADLNTVRWMLENNISAEAAESTGRTGLFHLASRNSTHIAPEYAEIARLLLVSGANPERFATGSSVLRTLVAGNRDINTLKVLLAYGANPDGHAKDERPPVCGAATPEFIDTLVAAGARLTFPERQDFNNVADCLALEDLDKKERKTVLKHLEAAYGIVPGGGAASTQAAPGRLPAGNWLYSEQTWQKPEAGTRAAVTVNYRVVSTEAALPRSEIISAYVQPQRFRQDGWQTGAQALQRCVKNCDAELAEWRAFSERNRLQRTFVPQVLAPDAGAESNALQASTNSGGGEETAGTSATRDEPAR